MQKEFKEALIGGIGGALVSTILMYLINGRFAWTYLFSFSIMFPVFYIYFHKKREEKKEGPIERVK